MNFPFLVMLFIVDMVIVSVFGWSERFFQKLLETGRIYPSTEAMLNIFAMGLAVVAVVVVNICIMVCFGVK